MLILVPNQKESACLLSSDFHSENPRLQARTFHTQNRYHQFEKMTKLKFIYLFFIPLILGCETEKKNTKNNLIGEWSKIEKVEDNDYPPPPPGFNRPFGIGFTEDKMELFNGFQRYDQDSVTGKRQLNYKGT